MPTRVWPRGDGACATVQCEGGVAPLRGRACERGPPDHAWRSVALLMRRGVGDRATEWRSLRWLLQLLFYNSDVCSDVLHAALGCLVILSQFRSTLVRILYGISRHAILLAHSAYGKLEQKGVRLARGGGRDQ